LENLQLISLDAPLSPTASAGSTLGRRRANASAKPQEEQKRFVLPEEPAQETGADNFTTAKPHTGQVRTLEPRRKAHSDESLDAPTEGLAVNLLASANLPKAAGETTKLANPFGLTVLNAVGPAGQTVRASETTTPASSNIMPLMQKPPGADQAIVDPTKTVAASPQSKGDAVISLDAQSQASARQADGTMTHIARAAGELVAGETLKSQSQQASDLSSGPAESIPASATATLAATSTTNAAVQVGTALETSTPAKATATSQDTTAGSQANAGAGVRQANRTGARSLSEILQQRFESVVSDKSAAGLNSDIPDSAKALAQAGQAQKTEGVSLPEAARSVEPQTPETNVLAGALGGARGSTDTPATAMPVSDNASVEIPKPAEQVIENIRQAVQNGQRDVTINLNPPELGRLRIRMYIEGDEIRGRLEVDNPRSFNEIRQQTELLAERLVGEGIMLRRLDVHLNSSGSQTSSFAAPQQDSANQGEWGQPGRGNRNADHGPDHHLTEMPEAGSARVAAKTTVGDSLSGEGLNVWI